MLANTDYSYLVQINATLNCITFVVLLLGLLFIKLGKEKQHKICMLTAAGLSALFLVSYLIYHYSAEPVKFQGEGAIRSFYYFILVSHIILAVVQVPMILLTILFGLQGKRKRHRRWARVTAPIWLYVSVTGVMVYWFLYWR